MAPYDSTASTLPGAEVARTGDTPRRSRDDRGMTTAEYAVGTVAAVGFAGVLIKVVLSPEIRDVILQLIMAVLKFFLKLPF